MSKFSLMKPERELLPLFHYIGLINSNGIDYNYCIIVAKVKGVRWICRTVDMPQINNEFLNSIQIFNKFN